MALAKEGFDKKQYWDNRKRNWRGQGPHDYQIMREMRKQYEDEMAGKGKKKKPKKAKKLA